MLRIDPHHEDAYHYVMNRGINVEHIFTRAKTKSKFSDYLSEKILNRNAEKRMAKGQ
jgi:hypothetical protein